MFGEWEQPISNDAKSPSNQFGAHGCFVARYQEQLEDIQKQFYATTDQN